MKPNAPILFLIALVLAVFAASQAMAYCIERDTPSLEQPPGSDEWLEPCCDGHPQIWWAENQPVPISIGERTHVDLRPVIKDAWQEWNDVPSSTFRFSDGGTTNATQIRRDYVNLVQFDPSFGKAAVPAGAILVDTVQDEKLVLGAAYCYTADPFTSNFRAVECDILINDKDAKWRVDDPRDLPYYDPFPVLLHELGHVTGLIHPSNDPKPGQGGRGCGAEAGDATMFCCGGQNDASTLELDDTAGLTAIYPRWTYRVRVLAQSNANPISGATVTMDGTCFPYDGVNIDEGGMVFGDIPECQIGEGDPSPTYHPELTFVTGSDGWTGYFRVMHDDFCFWASAPLYKTTYSCVTLPHDGDYYGTVGLESDVESPCGIAPNRKAAGGLVGLLIAFGALAVARRRR